MVQGESVVQQVAKYGQVQNTDNWAQQNDNAHKVDWNNASVPMWVKMGFPDNPEGIAAYNRIYAPQQAPTAAPLTTPADLPGPSTDTSYVGDNPFATYLRDNPGRGDAWAYLNNLLTDYGLQGLTDFTQKAVIAGRSTSEVTLDMTQQRAFKDRFPIIEQMKEANLPAWSPGEIVAYEKKVSGVYQSAHLPAGFYDDPVSDIQPLIAKGIPATEVESRVVNGYSAVMQQPQDVRDQWATLGYSTGDLVAHFLDPDLTESLLTKQQAATQRAAEAKRAGFGQLTTAQADYMGGRNDISAGQSQQGFSQLAQQHELFSALPGQQGQQGINQDQQLAATFGGDANAQAAIDKKAQERKAALTGGGSFTQGQDGRSGVGNAF